MTREEFFAKLATLDEEQLKKAVWNVYRRGSATLRERVVTEINPDMRDRRARSSLELVDAECVLGEVREFVGLARSGAYIGGDRRVSPRERTRWRFTFARLVRDALSGLQSEDVASGATAVEELIDLACATRAYDYFRSEDPVEAARFVVSDAVAMLWARIRDRDGFAAFAERAAPQLIRWESPYGWTRSGYGQISEQETSLAGVLAKMLPVTDMWIGFTDRYLTALDRIASEGSVKPAQGSRLPDGGRKERAANLAEWHRMVLDRLMFSDAEDRLDRLAGHPSLGGPEKTFLQAQLDHQRGDVSSARRLLHESLQELPGHQRFLAFATEVGAPLPRQSQHAHERQMQIASRG